MKIENDILATLTLFLVDYVTVANLGEKGREGGRGEGGVFIIKASSIIIAVNNYYRLRRKKKSII